jgi:hypothetical protein
MWRNTGKEDPPKGGLFPISLRFIRDLRPEESLQPEARREDLQDGTFHRGKGGAPRLKPQDDTLDTRESERATFKMSPFIGEKEKLQTANRRMTPWARMRGNTVWKKKRPGSISTNRGC